MSVLIVMAAIKKNAKTKTYSITIKSDYHKNQEAFQKTQYFKERFKTRYMIEAKNSELKNIHGYSRCDAAGLSNMQLQGAVSIFAVNLKRILKLKGEVCPNRKNRKFISQKGRFCIPQNTILAIFYYQGTFFHIFDALRY
mgnify:CR=1 FL=1